MESLSPALIAQRAASAFATDGIAPEIEWAAIEHFKQLARAELGRKFDADSDANPTHQLGLFAGQLQQHYPIPRGKGEDPIYKPRAALTFEEASWNVAQLRKSARARLEHADALQAWNDSRSDAQAAA